MKRKRVLSMLLAAAVAASPVFSAFAEEMTLEEESAAVCVEEGNVIEEPECGGKEETVISEPEYMNEPEVCVAQEGTDEEYPLFKDPNEVHYEADFSTAVPENWTLGEGFTVDNGALVNDWGHMNSKSICDAYRWSNRYTVSADMYADGGASANLAILMFNCKDAYNYYSVQIGGGTSGQNTFLKKTVGGNEATIATYSGYYGIKDKNNPATIKVTYDNGKITVIGIKDGAETVLFYEEKDSTLTAGKIGVGGVNGVGRFSNISVDGYGEECMLEQITQEVEQEEDGASLLPEIRIGFNMALSKTSVSSENITVIADKDAASAMKKDYYSVVLDEEDLSVIVVRFSRNLDAKTNYKIIVGKGIVSQEFGEGLKNEAIIRFKTRTPDFDITEAKFLNEYNGSIVFYPPAAAGKKVHTEITAVNRRMQDGQPYAVTAVLNNKNGEQLWQKVFTGILNNGESVILKEEFILPENVEADSKFTVYAWNGLETMKTLEYSYPPVIFDDSDFVNISSDKTENKITVAGALPNGTADRIITMFVTNPGKSVSDALEDGAIQHMAEITTDENGGFSYTFTLNNKTGSGMYNFYFGGDDFKTVKNEAYYYALAQDITNAVEDINSQTSVSETEKKIEQYKDILGYGTKYFNAISHEKLAQKVLNRVKQQPFSASDETEVKQFINQNALLEAYRQSKKNIIANSDSLILYQDILGLDTLDSEKSLTAVEFYNTMLNKNGKIHVLNFLIGKDYAEIEDFYKSFTEAVVVFGVCNCSVDGYAHISGLLTVNGAEAGLDLSSYNSARADRLLITKNICTLTQLQQYIRELSAASTPVPVSPGGGGGGGRTPTKNVSSIGGMAEPIITSPMPTGSPSSDKKEIILNDMTGYEWAETAVKQLMKDRIIIEPLDGMYRPMDNVTREEFTKMLVLASGITIENTESTFEDLSNDDWAMPYVMAAKNAGIINGIDDTHFGGKEDILRQDAMVIICRAFKLAYSGEETEAWDFDDIDSISDYAVDSMRTMVLLGMINGVGERMLSPRSNCTRAEAAQIIYNTLYNGGDSN